MRWWQDERRARLRRNRVAAWLFRAVRHSSLVVAQTPEGSSGSAALARVWAWQAWRRTVGRPITIRCAEGSLLHAPSWSRVAAVLVGTGLTEHDDAIFTLDLLRPGDLYVDVGANIGFYAVLAGRRGARVEAFEPSPQAGLACERSVALNGLEGSVTIHRTACGATTGLARFTTGLDIANHVVAGDEPGIDVQMSTLDRELAGLEAPLSMFKVDAEGHDLDVLRGALEAVERLRPVVMVEIWTGGGAPRDLLEPFGYRTYSYDPGSRALVEIPPGRRQGGNALLVSDSNLELVRERVRDADRPALHGPKVSWLR